jgi:muconolactone delta-isomerase
MKWMADITFKPGSGSEMAPLVPKEQEHIRELRGRGVVEHLYMTENRDHVWIILQGDSQDAIEQELRALPLYPYMNLQILSLLG